MPWDSHPRVFASIKVWLVPLSWKNLPISCKEYTCLTTSCWPLGSTLALVLALSGNLRLLLSTARVLAISNYCGAPLMPRTPHWVGQHFVTHALLSEAFPALKPRLRNCPSFPLKCVPRNLCRKAENDTLWSIYFMASLIHLHSV